ncbi:uncharacterized protein LOC142178108 [Nicotiana tabacum]|uniref:Uncharacterized protein LOC142178108 n=1 Tax=Nicotiana tabacum TaxID=4097 RepID=A0AC58U258_TOBAC
MHDVDAGGSATPGGKQLKRKGKEVCVDDDFVEDVPKIPTVKKTKLPSASTKQKTKKQSKELPKLVQKKNLVKNGHYFAPHNVDYGVLRFYTLCDPSIPSQIKELLSPNSLKLFKNTCFGYLLPLEGGKLNFALREFGLITGLNCVNKFTDYGYTSSYVSKLMNSYFPNKKRVEKWYLKNIVTNRSWVNDKDAVKLCILYLLEFFVCPSDKDHVSFIDHFRFYLVESDNFESYPLGIKSFNQVMESVRHRLNPRVHSYLIRGCSLALQVWLYECCSTVSTELATRCSDSIPRILRWSATKGQIWLTAFEEKMIKPEWIKFTSMTESGEEIGVLTMPNKIEYEDKQGAQSSEVPNADSPTLEPKHIDCQEDKESVAMKLRKLEKGIKQVDGKLEDFRKDVFKELHDLRVFIDDSMKRVLNLINRRYDVDEAKFAGSSTKNNDQKQGVNHQQFPFNLGDQVHASTSNTAAVCPEHVPVHVDLYGEFQEAAEVEQADIEDINAQSPIHGVTIAAQTEQVIEKQLNEGEDVHHVDEVVSEGSGIDKKSENVDSDMLDKFNKWLYHRTDKVFKRKKAPFSIKDNQINPWFDLRVEKVDKKEWFYSFAHPGGVLNGSHIDVIMYYLRKRGKYGPNPNNTRFTTTDCLFKSKIVQIYDKFISSPPEKKYSVIKPDDDVAEYILGYRLLANVAWDEVDYVIMPMNIVENFHWLLIVFDIVDRQLYVYDSMVSSHHHNAVESCVDKFSIIIPLYLSCTGFYGKRKNIDFKTTKAYIEKPVTDPLNTVDGCRDSTANGRITYVCIGDLSIPSEDLSDIDQHRRRYGALLWDYATKKQEDGSISESEVTGRLARRKGAPTLNEKTRVQRKKK